MDLALTVRRRVETSLTETIGLRGDIELALPVRLLDYI